MLRSEVDRNKISPMMLHYLELKDNYEDVILLYRLGDFYEMFFDDAEEASRALELTLTGRSAGLDEKVPMCGVPHHAADVYIDRLIKKGYKVAICEQLEDAAVAKGIVKRDVVQIVSSGTIINNASLNEKENNYVGAVLDFEYGYALSYADITTGEIYAYLTEHNENRLISEVITHNIKEVILDDDVSKMIVNTLRNTYNVGVTIASRSDGFRDYSYVYDGIKDDRLVSVIRMLLSYLCNNSKRDISHMQRVIVKEANNYLKMDIHTTRNLELVESMRLKDHQYSLLWLLDNTKTAMGSRKLKTFIESPLTNREVIEQRQGIVEVLLKEFIICDDLRKFLYEVYDLERLSGRVSLGNANARDLLQLKKSLKVLPSIKDILDSIHFYEQIDVVEDLYELLDKAIYEDPPLGVKEGYLIKEGYSKELDELKGIRSGGKDFISNFEREERERTGIKTLKVGFNKVFGYYIEISKGATSQVTDEMGYIRKQTLANCERYINGILKEKEDLVLGAEDKIINLEYELFNEIREGIKKYIPTLQSISKVISEIDVLQSFALVSEKYNYVKPVFSDNKHLRIISSRHPVVERVIKNAYVDNDIMMDDKTNVLLITGPNMSGKSTYMRQLGIIVIMAQIGCFVPAKEAVIPIFDKIFTRIGASDDLVSGESTFMVEMLEAATAIKNATENSLILFDELGRGTATFDGMSLAQAILEYIHDKVGCKTLFSTHYHELTDLEKTLSKLVNKHVAAEEDNGNIIFLHKVMDGSVSKSYGINVAKLAKLPDSVIERASQILEIYEKKEKSRDIVIQTTLPLDFESKKSEVEEELKKLNILELTPLQALNYLSELKEKVK